MSTARLSPFCHRDRLLYAAIGYNIHAIFQTLCHVRAHRRTLVTSRENGSRTQSYNYKTGSLDIVIAQPQVGFNVYLDPT